jgi:hypothetical protein
LTAENCPELVDRERAEFVKQLEDAHANLRRTHGRRAK